MLKVILFIFIFHSYFLLCDGYCKYYFSVTSGNNEVLRRDSNAPAGGDFCINLAIRYQKANDIVSTNYYENDESGAINYLSSGIFNATIKSKININCKSSKSVYVPGDTLSYSYTCCQNEDNMIEISCRPPSTPYLTGGHQGNGDPKNPTTKANNNNNNNSGDGSGAGVANTISLCILSLIALIHYRAIKVL